MCPVLALFRIEIVELDDTQVGMARGFTFQKLGLIQRRYEQICGSITGGMDVHRFSKLFAHLPYTSVSQPLLRNG